ncbi:MAG: hypothetical protein P4L51_09235 [Puia sp.]|nr:hypothetical protein [Puia sp.]
MKAERTDACGVTDAGGDKGYRRREPMRKDGRRERARTERKGMDGRKRYARKEELWTE